MAAVAREARVHAAKDNDNQHQQRDASMRKLIPRESEHFPATYSECDE
jgi:hypothetical protein